MVEVRLGKRNGSYLTSYLFLLKVDELIIEQGFDEFTLHGMTVDEITLDKTTLDKMT